MTRARSYLRTTCRMCAGANLQAAMSLTPTPPGNNFLRADQLSQPEPAYPLDLYFCGGCHHVQLGHVVDPAILYQNSYSYVSATSSRFVDHLRNYAQDMVRRFRLPPGSLVADIGSNDGTCLRFFAAAGMNVVGVDPATEIAARATASGIETIGDFFSFDLARRLRARFGPASFITSHNACAHIDDLDSVFRGVEHWLADDGVFVLEVGYLLDVYENIWFDTIYHEHVDYHTVAPFRALCARLGLAPFAVQRVSPQGGSIRVFIQKAGGPHQADGSIAELIALEHQRGLDRLETFVDFGRRIDVVGGQLRTLVGGLKAQGHSIAGYGAATKATTLMCHFRLGHEHLDFIADDNPLKQGLFSPVSHIPVVAAAELYARRPDYLLILAWNFAEPIMTAHRAYADQGGRFILPMPAARIVES
jgi:SAM-dependent methyltransferase